VAAPKGAIGDICTPKMFLRSHFASSSPRNPEKEEKVREKYFKKKRIAIFVQTQ